MCPYYSSWLQNQNTRPACMNLNAVALGRDVHRLWEQHVLWTRIVIMGIVYGLPDLDASTKRLLRNPKDFEAVLKEFYGDAIAAKFAALFTEHLVLAAQLVKEARAGNNHAAAETEKKWYANADAIAAFLASINPYWKQDEWRSMLYDHLRMTKAEAVDLLTGKYAESVAQFDEIETQALKMGDVMAGGITSQFPEHFSY